MEIIVVDDASHPSCHEIVHDYQTRDPRIRYLSHSKNRGAFEARHTGVRQAKGEYVAFLDSDDTVTKTIYANSLSRAIQTGAAVLFFNAQQCDTDGHHWVEAYNTIPEFDHRDGYEILDEIMSSRSTAWIWHVNWNKIIKRSIAEKVFTLFPRRRHLIMFEDLLWSTALYLELKDAPLFASISEIGLDYHRHDLSTTGKESYLHSLKKSDDILYVLKHMERLLRHYGAFKHFGRPHHRLKAQILSRYEPSSPSYHHIRHYLPYLRTKWHYWQHTHKNTHMLSVPNISLAQAEKMLLDRLDITKLTKGISIYGTGELGQTLLKALSTRGIQVNYFVSTRSADDILIQGIPVLTPREALRRKEKEFLIASIGSYTQICSTLQDEASKAHKDITIIGVG